MASTRRRSGPARRRADTAAAGRRGTPAGRPSGKVSRARTIAAGRGLTVEEATELERLRKELERVAQRPPLRWNAEPDDVQRSVVQLVLTLVEFIRKLLERQAIRRMESGTLTDEQTEEVGRALMQLEETVRDLAGRFGIDQEELNLDLGPLGRLM